MALHLPLLRPSSRPRLAVSTTWPATPTPITGLSTSNNWILATFPTAVSTIVVFPSIDHYGSAYDGYQYQIYGSNDGTTWTELFDALTVNASDSENGEPFTLNTIYGTAPTTVNNVLASNSGVGGTVGYIATFSFNAAYTQFAFGASTEAASNTEQELSAVGATAPVITQPSGNTGTSPDLPAIFSSTPGTTLVSDIDFGPTTGAGGISNPLDGDTPMILASVQPLSQTTWLTYTVGLSIATSNIMIDAYNGGAASGGFGSLIVHKCGQSSTDPSTWTDANCPVVAIPNLTGSGTSSYVIFRHTADWGAGGMPPSPPAGQTWGFFDFHPCPGPPTVPSSDCAAATPMEVWAGSQSSINPVCTDPEGSGALDMSTVPPTVIPVQCDVKDTLVDVYGDQTTHRGTQPVTQSWLAAATNVQMITSVAEAYPPTPANACPLTRPVTLGPAVWVNAACWYDIVVTPAQPPAPPTVANNNNNNFRAAPPASVVWGWQQPIPALIPGPIPTNELWASNPSPFFVSNTAQLWDIGMTNSINSNCPSGPACASPTFTPISTALGAAYKGDGTYLLNHSAKDTFGTTEKVITLITIPPAAAGTTCLNPETEPAYSSSPFHAPCYETSYFTVPVNLDSTPPTISATLSPAGAPAGTFYVGQIVYPVYTCIDPLINGVASGIATCGGIAVPPSAGVCPTSPAAVTSPTALTTSTAGTFSYQVTATDCAGNVSTPALTVSYTVAPTVDLQINTLPFPLSSNVTLPGIPLALGVAVRNLSAVAADDVTVTTTFTTPTPGVLLGTPSATISTVTCSNSPCTLKGITLKTIPCKVAWPMVTCSESSLGPLSANTGLWMEIIVPVSNKSKAGTFTSTSTVGSAGLESGKAYSVTEKYTIF